MTTTTTTMMMVMPRRRRKGRRHKKKKASDSLSSVCSGCQMSSPTTDKPHDQSISTNSHRLKQCMQIV